MKSIGKLAEGFHAFKKEFFVEKPNLFNNLVNFGQKPRVAIVACSDSRVDPAIVLQAEPGDIFSIRNVANLVPPYERGGSDKSTGAALEFAVRILGVSSIVVFGHAHCAGIRALWEHPDDESSNSDFISPWSQIALSAKQQIEKASPHATIDEKARACEQAATLISMDNLMTFPWIRERVTQGSLKLHGWYIDIEVGELFAYDPAAKRFKLLEARKSENGA